MNIEKYIIKNKHRLRKKHRCFFVRRKGTEYVNIFPGNLVWIKDGQLRELLAYDEYGIYKKVGVKIPFQYRRKYKHLKREREWQIYAKFYRVDLSRWQGILRKHPLFDTFTQPSEPDRIEMKKLVEKG